MLTKKLADNEHNLNTLRSKARFPTNARRGCENFAKKNQRRLKFRPNIAKHAVITIEFNHTADHGHACRGGMSEAQHNPPRLEAAFGPTPA